MIQKWRSGGTAAIILQVYVHLYNHQCSGTSGSRANLGAERAQHPIMGGGIDADQQPAAIARISLVIEVGSSPEIGELSACFTDE
jgi:hypothetical protein